MMNPHEAFSAGCSIIWGIVAGLGTLLVVIGSLAIAFGLDSETDEDKIPKDASWLDSQSMATKTILLGFAMWAVSYAGVITTATP